MLAFRDQPIRRKLLLVLLLVVSAVLGVSSVALVLVAQQAARTSMIREFSALANLLAAQSAVPLSTDPSTVQPVLDLLQAEPHVVYACVYDRAGKLVAQYQRAGAPAAASPPRLPGRTEFLDDTHLEVFQEVHLEQELVGTIFLQVVTDELRQQLRRSALISLAVFCGGLLIAVLLSLLLHRAIADPIRQLSRASQALARDRDYSKRVVKRGNDELGALCDAFNTMTEELARFHATLEDRVQQRTDELRQNIERTRRIVDTAHDAFVAMDASGIIVDWNSQAEALFGWSRAEALGMTVAESIVPEAHREAHVRGLAHFLATGQGPVLGRRIEIPATDRNGTTFPVELTITPIRDGKSYVFAAFLHDITDRKRAEADLQQAKDAAEAATRAKSEFLANMSHEIRTPMNGILGMSELLAGTELRADQQEFLGLIQQSAQSLLRLLNDILDFSKIEAGKLELEEIEFSLQDCVGKAVRLLGVRAAEKGLELAFRIDPATPDRLMGDPGRIRQIIVNLVGNAIKFTERGEVVVDVRPESIAAGKVKLHASVRDTGLGIPQDKQHQLFQAFTQVDASTTRKYGGTGLGLTISQRLIHLMGGRIWVKSEPGQGATFHFTAELRIAPDQAPRRPAELSEIRGLEVMVVDDNSTNRTILGELLKSWQLNPLLADSGPAALDVIVQARRAGQAVELVLLDYHMPEMDGLQFAQRLQTLPDWQPCPIILLSSSVSGLDSQRLQAVGIHRFMSKPVIASELLAAMLDQLGKIGRAKPGRAGFPALAPRKILLAEDNPINQKVILGLLHQWGQETVVAADGKQAVEAALREPFDLVLMDVQMPEMDGYEATAAIRQHEQGSGRRLPIIALTAEAMIGDRERCLEAGMDDYLTKPIDTGALYARIAACEARGTQARATAGDGQATSAPSTPGEMPATDAVDWDLALRIAGGDSDLLRELVAAARTQAPDLIAAARSALEAGDAAALRRSAHTLKSTSHYFGAINVASIAQRLEEMAREGNLAETPAAVEELAREVERFVAALDDQAEG